jgi:methylphosphotriester-DNA--protein-cysteine methyltransferase
MNRAGNCVEKSYRPVKECHKSQPPEEMFQEKSTQVEKESHAVHTSDDDYGTNSSVAHEVEKHPVYILAFTVDFVKAKFIFLQ